MSRCQSESARGLGGSSSSASIAILPTIILIALGLRLAHLHYIEREACYRVPTVMPDSSYNHQWALQALGQPFAPGKRAYYVPPLYPELLRVMYLLIGPNPYIVKLIQVVVASLNPLFVYWIALRLAGTREAITASLLCAVYPLFIFYEASLLKESLLVGAVCVALLMTIDAARACEHRWRRWAVAGVYTGVLCLFRPNMLAFFGLITLWIVVADAGSRWPRRLGQAMGWLAGGALAIAPVTARNRVVAGEHVVINWNGGLNFYIGNRAGADAYFRGIPGVTGAITGEAADSRRVAETATGRTLKDSEVSDYYVRLAWADIQKSWPDFFRRLWRKFLYSVNGLEVPQAEHFYFARESSPVLRLPLPGFGILLPWAILGGWACRRTRPASAVLNLFCLCNLASLLMFYVSDRYRLPLAPVVIVYAAIGMWSMFDSLRYLRPGWVVWSAALVACGYVLTRHPLAENLKSDFSMPLVNYANYYLARDKPREALPLLARIQNSGWERAEASAALGHCYLQLGDLKRAGDHIEKAIDLGPQRAEGYFLRGQWNLVLDLIAQAAEDFSRVLELNPTVAEAHYYLGALRARDNRNDEALASLQRAQELNPSIIPVYVELARLYRAQGKTHEAREIIEQGLERSPNDARLKRELVDLNR
jgi:4-amino-4-deoxy-L-arabinose transferase-like glycosyltransferase